MNFINVERIAKMIKMFHNVYRCFGGLNPINEFPKNVNNVSNPK